MEYWRKAQIAADKRLRDALDKPLPPNSEMSGERSRYDEQRY